MDDNGYTVATPRDVENCATESDILEGLQSSYVRRAKDVMPRQGSKPPWNVPMHYEKDRQMLLEDPVDDGVLSFSGATVPVGAVSAGR